MGFSQVGIAEAVPYLIFLLATEYYLTGYQTQWDPCHLTLGYFPPVYRSVNLVFNSQ